jgi:transcriptional regulator with XRE-family HTH domain
MSESKAPYTSLGNHLKYVREQASQSLEEVSGAVEIDEKKLAQIEAGEVRPAEDILLLLISHFEVQDTEALQLWELADYGGDIPEQIRPEIDIPNNGKPVLLLAMDMRTQYTDGVDINVSKAGVTMNFTQAGIQNQTPVARVGMSLSQAEAVMRAMHQALMQANYLNSPRQLPPKSSDHKSL